MDWLIEFKHNRNNINNKAEEEEEEEEEEYRNGKKSDKQIWWDERTDLSQSASLNYTQDY